MQSALGQINLGYALNPKAHMAMSYPTGLYGPHRDKLMALFEKYEPPTPEWKSIVWPRYDKVLRKALITVPEGRKFEFCGLWKYIEKTSSWQSIKPTLQTDPNVIELTNDIGLFWATWKEDGHDVRKFVYAAPVLCEDVHLRPAPPSMVAVCIPGESSALATFVPDPTLHCKN